MEDKPKHDYICKIIILGDLGVGKTSIIKNYSGEDMKSCAVTVGIDFKNKYVTLKDKEAKKVCKVQVWDTAG